MKKIIIILGLIAPSVLFGQLDRSVRPEAGKAPTINIKDSETFTTANGITVILSENHKLPKVSFELYTGADPIMEGQKAGLSEFMGSMIMSGTTNRSKDQLDKEVDYIGASLSANADGISLSCLTKHLDKGLALMSDVLLNANFPASEFARIKKEKESGLLSAKSEAGVMANNAESKAIFTNHPYGTVMTEVTLNNITNEDLSEFYKFKFTPKGSYLVVVGDITMAQVKAMMDKYFATWNGIDVHKAPTADGTFNNGNRVIFVNKPGAVQSVINVSFPMKIRKGDEDQLALEVLNGVFGGGGFGTRLMQNLREDKAFTYGAYSTNNITEFGSWNSTSGNFRNEVTDSAITQILLELNRITTELVTDDELSLTKAAMAGNFARSLERASTVARFALNINKLGLAKDYYQTYLKRLDAITKDDLLRVAKKYFTGKNCNIVVVGNDEVLTSLKQFDTDGKIEKLDAFGDEVKERTPADITKDQLTEKFILAVTKTTSLKKAKKVIKKIKSKEEKMEVTIAQAPFPLSITRVWMAPNMEGDKMEAQGMVFQKSYFDGTTGGSSSMQGGKKELSAEEIAAKKKSTGLFPELNYATSGVTYEILGVEEVNGKKYYVLNVNDGYNESFDYYNTATFLKEKSIAITKQDGETVEITTDMSEFKDFNGLMYATKTVLQVSGQVLSGEVKSITFNGKIDLTLFK
ncbi:MAG: pitrilysin family protein [Bacteroidota bacterium]